MTIAQPVFTTDASAVTVKLETDADKTVITTPAGCTVGVGASSTSFLLGADGTYTFTGSTVTPSGTHGAPGVPEKRITEIDSSGVTEVQQGATF